MNSAPSDRRGVALIIVLGLLSVLTILAVAFAIAMRVERLAARNYADGIRAEQLIQVCLARAMEDVNDSMTRPKPVVYPYWENREPTDLTEAMASYVAGSGDRCTNILTREAAALIPDAVLREGSELVRRGFCHWSNVLVNVQGTTPARYGRIAYLAVNTSGFLDANLIGGATRTASTTVAELDISGLAEMTDSGRFLDNRNAHVRFETPTELLALNTDALQAPLRNLFTYSLDIGRDFYFVDRNNFGTPEAALAPKFNINAVTNYQPSQYGSAQFRNEYLNPLIQHLQNAGITWKPDDIAWNIINWIDTDRYPQGQSDGHPEWHSEGGEAMPLVNEIYYKPILAGSVTQGQFQVEFWYPFVGVECGNVFRYRLEIQQTAVPYLKEGDIPNMDATGKNGPAFFVAESDVLPTAADASIRVTVLYQPPTGAAVPVDMAMNRSNFTAFAVGKVRAVDDPRSNGKAGYWMFTESPTMGALNTALVTQTVRQGDTDLSSYVGKPACQPWKWAGDNNPNHLRQGLPLVVRNGPMVNIGELGYIYLANREDVTPVPHPNYKWFWSSIDLMHSVEGAYLLDHLTVRSTNAVAQGLVSISTKQEDILKALLYRSKIGYPGKEAVVDPNDSDIRNAVEGVVRAILDRQTVSGTNYISFQDLFDGENPPGGAGPGGRVADAFRRLGKTVWNKAYPGEDDSDPVREGAFRNMLDLITFRQNILTLVLAAQVLAPDETTAIAEKRAVATVYRDAYTGNFFVRSFKWLTD